MDYTQIFYPPRFAVGPDSVKAMRDYIDKENFRRCLVVTDKNLAGSSVFRKVTEQLDEAAASYCVFSEVIPNPNPEIFDRAAAVYHKEKCDFIIAVGGGSAVDVAKGASLVAANGGSIRHYFGMNRSLYQGVPVIAVNTTAGTGAEVTRFLVLTDRENHQKYLVMDDHCLVSLAISDPCLMTDLPAEITIATGLDALTHAVEAYCSVNHNPFSDGLALQAVKLIDRSLEKAVRHPEDLSVRTDLCWAASLAGYAFSNSGLGLMHAIGFSIENFREVPHGVAVGMVMPYVLDFNRRAIGDRIGSIGKFCGLEDEVLCGARTVRRMTELIVALRLPSLRDIGFDPKDIPALADMALDDPTLGTNAIQPTREEMIHLIESIYCENLKD